ncbi:MAG TPA: hypothetical protein VKB47_14320 [Terracidiphilus sp.]|nr:hypothetical protein [Terracidiphilus sp.]
MAKSYMSGLSMKAQRELLDDLNYLNLSEIKSFCKRHSIPFKIVAEAEVGKIIATKDIDRKGVILDRIRHFLKTGVVPEKTCFPAAVVSFEPLPDELAADDRLYYGQYDKTNRAMNTLLKSLTNGYFKDGAIARMLAREFWANGKAPTFAEYAAAWMQSLAGHTVPNPEWAFLSDRANYRDVQDWKKLRAEKASKALRILNQLVQAR